ncbi:MULTISPECIES: HtaA domain-containing protein [unclassified Microbacterium]|uniref:HtaA domain-containing protein n=1 Tax=unclassified Microbacterium TaxID=2609290 RepID=UPI00214CCC70|nr:MULTISPECIES: HtaA domain-containing protein [unclassified Microbacterium]MCR2808218.1 HtaA domain-containing protein [Microbacterium sp. zg.B185]WIM19323.1 HtaA domain-containing protein [Microbacterium sp. zg-B185]
MRTSPRPRVFGRLAQTGLSALLLAAAAVAVGPAAASEAATPTDDACEVSAAEVSWGFKESFRSYISGTIADGTWEVTGGAGYQTPNFTWTGGTGWYDPDTQTGSVAFPGGIRFTGHGGLLDTTFRDPTLEFTGPGAARVHLDVSGVSMEEALAGGTAADSVSQVPFIDVDLTTATIDASRDGVTIAAAAAPTAITPEGFAAFANYEAGSAFDPITITVTAVCASAQTQTPSPGPPTAPVDAAPAADSRPADASPGWISWAVAAFVAAGAAVGGVLLARRRGTGRNARTGSGGAA